MLFSCPASAQRLRRGRTASLEFAPLARPARRPAGGGGDCFVACGLVCLLLLVAASNAVSEAPKRADLLYNTAVERYLNGNYELALEAIRESIELDPENERTKQFAIKLLLQMATRAHLGKRHETAMRYLEEARAIDSHNRRINELYMMVQEKPGPGPPPGTAALPRKEAKKEDPNRRRAGAAPPLVALTEPTALPDVTAPLRTSASPRTSERASGAPTVPSRWLGAGASGSSGSVPRAGAPGAGVSPRASGASSVPSLRLGAGSGPEGLRPPIGRTTAFPWKTTMAASALFLVCAGAGFIYLRRAQERVLQDSLRNIREVEKSLREEVEKSLKEEKKEIEEQKRGQEKRDQEERERFRLEELQRKKFDRMIEKPMIVEKEEPRPQEIKSAKEIREELLVVEASSVSRESAYNRLASQLRAIYELDKEKAVDFVKPLLGDSDPLVRVYLAGGLSQVPVPEFVGFLFQLWNDPDMKVRAESLRGLHNFYKRPDFTGIFSERLRVQIRQLIRQEKRKGDWVL